jgi:hypothetical protein
MVSDFLGRRGAADPPTSPVAEGTSSALAGADRLAAAGAASGGAAGGSRPASAVSGAAGTRSEWVLFNDFAVCATPAEEVVQLFGGRKVPCLLYFSRVGRWAA